MLYQNAEDRKQKIREFIISNPQATSQDIKKKLHTKVEKVYSSGMEGAFKDAGIEAPRTFKRMSHEEKKKILIDYVRANPKAGGHIIKKETKINILSVFKNTQDLFECAGVKYPRIEFREHISRSNEEKKEKIIQFLKLHPLASVNEIGSEFKTHPYSLFRSFKEIYSKAGIPYVDRSEKRALKKKLKVIDFIRSNPFATQREINRFCKTHIYFLFKGGIFEAYKEAGVEFPYERINIHGAALKEIKDNALSFEIEMAKRLSGYGSVSRLVKTKRGFADIILERKGKKAVIELKNYKSHEISISQVKQLNKYLEDINSPLGFLICLRKPRKDSFLMGENKLFILTESELSKIPEAMDL